MSTVCWQNYKMYNVIIMSYYAVFDEKGQKNNLWKIENQHSEYLLTAYNVNFLSSVSLILESLGWDTILKPVRWGEIEVERTFLEGNCWRDVAAYLRSALLLQDDRYSPRWTSCDLILLRGQQTVTAVCGPKNSTDSKVWLCPPMKSEHSADLEK